MKTPTLDQTSFKWLCGGLLLGLVLGVCFTVLLRPFAPLPSAAGLGNSVAATQALSEGLHRSQQLRDQGKTEEAARVLENLIQQFPSSPEPYNNLAALQASEGELETGRELLEKALRTHEGYAAAYENLGVIYSEIARNSYGKALRLDIPPGAPQLKVITVSVPTPTSPVSEVGKDALASAAPVEAPRTVQGPAPGLSDRPSPPPAASQHPAQPAVPPPAPATSRNAAAPSSTQEVLQVLNAWAQSWSDRDVPRYLTFYSAQFRPDDGMERTAWEEQRRQRIQHPSWIKVSLSNIVVTPTGPDSVQIRLVQEYSADTYKDRTRKTINLVREAGTWRILTENTLGRAR